MSGEYSVSRKEKKVSKNAVLALIIGLISLMGFLFLLLISTISVGKMGVAGGFFGDLFFLMAIFGAIWGILSYDEARTVHRYKKAGIAVNLLGVLLGVLFIVL